jgi:hypothetical protein
MIQARVLSFRLLSAGLVLTALAAVSEAGKPAIPAQKPIKGLPAVKLFDAMQAEQVDVKLVQKDEASGNLFIENNFGKPINVQMPEAFVGVHVLNQGFFDNNQSGFGNQSGQGNGAQSQGGQNTGGGASNNSLFSVPAGKIVRIPVKTVCLEHGRPEPSSRMEYRIFPVERFSRDVGLFELLTAVGRGKTPQKVAQAAAWNMASGKSWKELSAMKFRRAGSLPDTPHFRAEELTQARKLIEKSKVLAEKRNEPKGDKPAATSVVASRDTQAR